MEDNKKKGLGMVLEGGGMRGLYTAGVLDELMEQGIYADSTVGVSAGAIFGCNYKSRQIGRTLRYNTRFCKDKRYMGLKSWITTGDLYSKDFAYGEVPWKLDVFDTETFARSPMKFTVVCTDIETGKPCYQECRMGDRLDVEWMRAHRGQGNRVAWALRHRCRALGYLWPSHGDADLAVIGWCSA